MVAIRNSEAERFLAKPSAGIFAYLIFGADNGMVTERAAQALRANIDNIADVIQFDADALSKHPASLAEEYFAIPMFGGRRAVKIEAGGRNICPILEPILRGVSKDCALVVVSGPLKRDAPLRKLFESCKSGAAIECLTDDADALQRLIDDELTSAGLSITADARAFLVTRLGVDRMLSRSEISKLVCYARGQSEITLRDIQEAVADASDRMIDEIIDDAFSGSREIVGAMAKLLEDARDVSSLLNGALRHALLLHKASAEIAIGRASIASALTQIWLPAPRKKRVEAQLSRWSEARLLEMIDLLGRASQTARRDGKLAQHVAAKALWSIASSANAAPA